MIVVYKMITAKYNRRSVRNYPFFTLYIRIKFDKLYWGIVCNTQKFFEPLFM